MVHLDASNRSASGSRAEALLAWRAGFALSDSAC